MSPSVAILATIVAVAGAALPAYGAGARSSSVDPSLLVLRPSDLPSGYRPLATTFVSNEQADRNASGPHCRARPALSAEAGRVDGFDASFARRKPESILESSASVHRSSGGAGKVVASFGRVLSTCRGVKLRRVPVGGRLGQQAELWTGSRAEAGRKSKVALVVWRWHERVGMLISAGPVAMDASLLVRLAKKQEARMEAAS